jgi:CRISPR/Cas system-associated protein Cas5 (RAMP superfamily)
MDHPDRQTEEGLWFTREAEGGKKEMKSRKRSSPYTTESAVTDRRRKLEEVDVDNENEESMDEGNNIRYLTMNWIDVMTECQVQIENHMLPRKLSGDDRKPAGTIPYVNKIKHATAESSRPKGDKDCQGH